MNEEAASRKKIKTCNEEALILKLEKRKNLRIFFSSAGSEGVKCKSSNAKVYIRKYTNNLGMGTTK